MKSSLFKGDITMPIFISIVMLLLALPLFSGNSSGTTKTTNRNFETQERMPMIRGDESVDPNMPMFPKSDFIAVDKQPVPIKEIQPVYPDLAKRKIIEGTVWVKVLVDQKGNVKKAVVMKSDSEFLNKSALRAAKEWTFIPALLSGEPVEIWAAIPFRFKLNK
jgi:TonB family protein